MYISFFANLDYVAYMTMNSVGVNTNSTSDNSQAGRSATFFISQVVANIDVTLIIHNFIKKIIC